MQRWFLANNKGDDAELDAWRADLERLLSSALDDDIEVVDGKADFQARASDAGGWNGWAKGLAMRTDVQGDYVFDGMVRPVSRERGLVVGRPTYQIISGFLDRPKVAVVEGFTVAAWNVGEEAAFGIDPDGFAPITAIRRLPGDDFKAWGRVDVPDAFRPEQSAKQTKRADGVNGLSHEAVEFCELCRTVLDEAEETLSGKPGGVEFHESIREKVGDMHDKVASSRMVPTEGQWRAVQNMRRGVAKWRR